MYRFSTAFLALLWLIGVVSGEVTVLNPSPQATSINVQVPHAAVTLEGPQIILQIDLPPNHRWRLAVPAPDLTGRPSDRASEGPSSQFDDPRAFAPAPFFFILPLGPFS